jgi:hypothetical protein
MKVTPKKRSAGRISAGPLISRLASRGVAQSKFAVDHGYKPADITNWKARGVPRAELPKIAQWCGLTVEAYLAEASGNQTGVQRPLEAAALLDDYNALPDGLKEIVARKAAALRRFVDAFPPFLRESLHHRPRDPAKHREWEQQIEDAIARLDPRDTDKPG